MPIELPHEGTVGLKLTREEALLVLSVLEEQSFVWDPESRAYRALFAFMAGMRRAKDVP